MSLINFCSEHLNLVLISTFFILLLFPFCYWFNNLMTCLARMLSKQCVLLLQKWKPSKLYTHYFSEKVALAMYSWSASPKIILVDLWFPKCVPQHTHVPQEWEMYVVRSPCERRWFLFSLVQHSAPGCSCGDCYPCRCLSPSFPAPLQPVPALTPLQYS